MRLAGLFRAAGRMDAACWVFGFRLALLWALCCLVLRYLYKNAPSCLQRAVPGFIGAVLARSFAGAALWQLLQSCHNACVARFGEGRLFYFLLAALAVVVFWGAAALVVAALAATALVVAALGAAALIVVALLAVVLVVAFTLLVLAALVFSLALLARLLVLAVVVFLTAAVALAVLALLLPVAAVLLGLALAGLALAALGAAGFGVLAAVLVFLAAGLAAPKRRRTGLSPQISSSV